MLRYGLVYLATAVPLLVMDYIWLNFAASRIYRPQLGSLLLDNPNLVVAAGFYLVYSLAVVILVVLPALGQGNWALALGLGAVLGIAAYGTYDITNLATLRGWSVLVTVVDIAWGMTVTALAATIGYFVSRALLGPGG